MEFQFLKMFYDVGVFTKVQIQECLQKGLITQTTITKKLLTVRR